MNILSTKISSAIKAVRAGLTRLLTCVKGFIFARDKRENIRLTASVRLLVLWAFFLEFVIECLNRHSLIKAGYFALTSFYVFAFNALIIFLFFIPSLCLRHKLAYETTVTALWLGLGITNCVVTCFRVTPFSMIDILNLPSVLPIIGIYLNVVQIVLIALAIAAAVVGLVFLWIKSHKGGRNIKKALVTVIVTAVLLPLTLTFGLYTGMLSKKFTSLTKAYADYGFPYCFAVSVVDRGISKPSGYSNTSMDEIIHALNGCPDDLPKSKPNVIFVQLESFFDVNDLVNIRFTENPIPYFTELCRQSISGYLNVPVIGAGTVNTEFEVLTGMSLGYFGTGEYPYKTSLMSETCESTAYNLAELGYSTHAIHNYQGAFYQRNKVYKNLGFDTFTPLEYMQDVEYNISGVWPVDRVLTKEILAALDSTESSDFVMAVSVQGHGKYPPNDLPEDYVPQIDASFVDGTIEGGLSDIGALVYYVNQLHEMDLFVNELVEAIRAYPEDCLLVMYGDHLPSLSFSENDLANGSIYQTPYVIVSNFGLEDNAADMGELYAYQLAARTMGLVGIHNGNLTKLHQYYSETDNYQLWLEKLEYDMLGNHSPHYLYGGKSEYYTPKLDMQMGTYPIVIERYDITDDMLVVYGSGFNEWSKLVLDGRVFDQTELVDNNTLILTGRYTGIMTLSVAQVADGGAVLGKSDEVVYSGAPEDE